MSDPSAPTPGWFPDPLGRYDHRYFNGTSWTSDVSVAGERFVDPLGSSTGPAADQSRNGAATASVVMGSIGLVIAFVPFVVVAGFALAVLALVFGIKGLRRSRPSGVGRGASIAGIVMGGLGLAATVVGVALSVMVWNEVIAFAEPGPFEIDVSSCDVDGRRVDVDGTITNLDDERRGYTVFVEVDGRTEFVVVDDVDGGETVRWATVITTPSVVSECRPEVIVQGPFPYGVEVDPVTS
ncbi:DUF2510 domain-containing protein [Ilumatobacter sp.]|uniref:DUF2510 domain-containing protein n=1 Tax=Ilumatobacter sp. TaxID=1967498 RepID=UPI003AF51E2B